MQFRVVGFFSSSSSHFTLMHPGVSSGVTFNLIPNRIGFCHGQISIETATYSLWSSFALLLAASEIILECRGKVSYKLYVITKEGSGNHMRNFNILHLNCLTVPKLPAVYYVFYCGLWQLNMETVSLKNITSETTMHVFAVAMFIGQILFI